MKKLILTLGIAVVYYCSYAQNTFPTPSGNVGIGTTSPTNKLEVDGGASEVAVRISTANTGASAASLVLANSSKTAFNDGLQIIHGAGVTKFNDLVGTNLMSLDLSNGKVGIGTTSPGSKLTVSSSASGNEITSDFSSGIAVGNEYSSFKFTASAHGFTTAELRGINTNGGVNAGEMAFHTAGTEKMRIRSSGNVGIGTTNPSENLSVVGGGSVGNVSLIPGPTYSGYKLTLTTQAADEGFNMTMGGTKIMNAYGYNNADEVGLGNLGHENLLYLNSSGNVLIGKTSQTNSAYKLDINGGARANEIVVNTTGADFVFDKEYRLPKLSEVKTYINKNHHLPEIPSAAEMKKNGMSVGELNTRLLQKVEELTLYLIEKDEQLEQQRNRDNEQQRKIEQQDARIRALESVLKPTGKQNLNH